MKPFPKVTILMPVYNGERYLREAIESVLIQTFTDFELIILDDGSTDGSVSIINDYVDERICLVQNPDNLKLVATLNLGLGLARGEFIARMDADDISCSPRLAEQVAYLDQHPEVGLVSTNFYLIDSSGAITSGPVLSGSMLGAQVEWELLWGNPIVHPSVMFRTALARACGGYPVSSYCEDYVLWLKMARYTKLAVLAQPLLHLRKHDQNMTDVNLEHHLEAVVTHARAALASRIGYEPTLESVRFIRYPPGESRISAESLKDMRKLLYATYDRFTSGIDLETEQVKGAIKSDLIKRLQGLVEYADNHNRLQSLLTLVLIVSLSPITAFSKSSVKTMLRIFTGRNFLRIMRRLSHHRRT